jgi:HTH-type transcriptional repressor of NAD biosynthesis genes
VVVLAFGEYDCGAALPLTRVTRDCHPLRGLLGERNNRLGALAAISQPDMKKRFRHGLVVGKFAPLHRGHELLIRRAFDECEGVVIISYCKPEFPGCDAERRRHWLSELFPAARILMPTDANLSSRQSGGHGFREVPANDADEKTHRRFCGFLCTDFLGITVEAVFTSENYGDGFAGDLTRFFRERDQNAPAVQHVLVDRERRNVPASGTKLRNDVHGNRAWLSPLVYASFVRRICLLGGESSGKSLLTESLARELKTQHVHEYGRDLWEAKNGRLAFDDLLHIALGQVAMEEQAVERANRYLFCDTSPLTTLFYSRHLFGRAEPELERLANRSYDLVVLCAPDFPFVQDGTRQDDSFRAHQHEWYLRELADRGIPFLLVEGSLQRRMATIVDKLTEKRTTH